MTERELRWGLLGSAKISETEMGPAMVRAAHHRVVAIASRRAEAAESLAASVGGARVHSSYEALLADPEVMAVYNPLPNSLHAEWTIKALEAGKHVLCEKPMAMSSAEARRMVDAARASGRVLMEGFMYRFHPRIARVREMLREGVIGDVRLVRATYTFDLAASADVRSGSVDDDLRLNSDLGGGVVSDLGSYCVSGLRWYANARPTRVSSWAWNAPGRAVETTLSAIVDFDNGVTGQIYAALDVPGGGHVEIVGTAGRIRMVNAFRMRRDQGPVSIEVILGDRTIVETLPFRDQYESEIEHFASLVHEGRESDVVSLQDSLDNAATLEAIRRSWNEGIVEVAEVRV